MTSYDSADRAAILEFAQRLEGNTIAETNKKYGAPVPESTTDREVPYMRRYYPQSEMIFFFPCDTMV